MHFHVKSISQSCLTDRADGAAPKDWITCAAEVRTPAENSVQWIGTNSGVNYKLFYLGYFLSWMYFFNPKLIIKEGLLRGWTIHLKVQLL